MTAEECLNSYVDDYYEISTEGAKNAMIEFAKYHVEKALKKAAQEAEINFEVYIDDYEINRDSILNAYPLENIK
jgi:hypothetical protein